MDFPRALPYPREPVPERALGGMQGGLPGYERGNWQLGTAQPGKHDMGKITATAPRGEHEHADPRDRGNTPAEAYGSGSAAFSAPGTQPPLPPASWDEHEKASMSPRQ